MPSPSGWGDQDGYEPDAGLAFEPELDEAQERMAALLEALEEEIVSPSTALDRIEALATELGGVARDAKGPRRT